MRKNPESAPINNIKTFPQLTHFQRKVLSDWGILGKAKCRNQEVE